jgi:hypothetical protein
MASKKFAYAQDLIEEVMGIVESINVKGSVSEKSKKETMMALGQALNSLNWMKQMNGNKIVQYLDAYHDESNGLSAD